jgi:hypothetical protein
MPHLKLTPRILPVRSLAAAAVVALVAGCGSSTNVTGKVTYKGNPVSTGSITLVASNGTVYSGVLGTDGTFSIPDVPTGDVQVAVVGANPATGTKPPPAGRSAGGGGGGPTPGVGRGGPAPGGVETAPSETPPVATGPVLPPEYGDPRTSGLTAKIKAGQPLNIDLK